MRSEDPGKEYEITYELGVKYKAPEELLEQICNALPETFRTNGEKKHAFGIHRTYLGEKNRYTLILDLLHETLTVKVKSHIDPNKPFEREEHEEIMSWSHLLDKHAELRKSHTYKGWWHEESAEREVIDAADGRHYVIAVDKMRPFGRDDIKYRAEVEYRGRDGEVSAAHEIPKRLREIGTHLEHTLKETFKMQLATNSKVDILKTTPEWRLL